MNVIAYKWPEEKEPSIYRAGEARPVSYTSKSKSFIVSPFDPERPGWSYNLIEKLQSIPDETIEKNFIAQNFEEKTKAAYSEYIDYIKKNLRGEEGHKIVASRRSRIKLDICAESMFLKLCDTYPDAFIFFISTKEFGSWVGASPEKLLCRENFELTTMSLAGTRVAGSPGTWDLKNDKEQEIVTKEIASIFNKHGIDCRICDRTTLKAGKLEHLMTPIKGQMAKETDIKELISELSPTPALGGYPRDTALNVIKKWEGDRVLYGGYAGVVDSCQNFKLNVILRCGYLEPGAITLFAGGGITFLSDSEEEWKETEQKMKTLKNVLEF